MDLKLKDKHVLVTGASKGIGLATAQAFAAEGARVTLVSRRAEALAEAAGGIGQAADYFVADLSEDQGREAVFDAYPDIDILVNNAGAIKRGSLDDMSMEDWREGFDLKFWGYVHLCKLYVPQMSRRGSGAVVNIIGIGGRVNSPGYVIGAAANSGLISFTNAIGAGSTRHNVRVFGINPASTLTDRMSDRLRVRAQLELGDPDRWQDLIDPATFPFGRPKAPEEVAALAVMLASPNVHYLSGTVVDMDGGTQWAK